MHLRRINNICIYRYLIDIESINHWYISSRFIYAQIGKIYISIHRITFPVLYIYKKPFFTINIIICTLRAKCVSIRTTISCFSSVKRLRMSEQVVTTTVHIVISATRLQRQGISRRHRRRLVVDAQGVTRPIGPERRRLRNAFFAVGDADAISDNT